MFTDGEVYRTYKITRKHKYTLEELALSEAAEMSGAGKHNAASKLLEDLHAFFTKMPKPDSLSGLL